MIFRVLETKKGTYRTNSSYFLQEIEELIERTDLMKDLVGYSKKNET